MNDKTSEKLLRLKKESPERFERVLRGQTSLWAALREAEHETLRLRCQRPESPDGDARAACIVVGPFCRFGEDDPTTWARLEALPIPDLAAPNCHLYLWLGDQTVLRSGALLVRWGFRFVTFLTWCMPRGRPTDYFVRNAQFIAFAIRGHLLLARRDVGTSFLWDAPDDDGLPPGFFDLIETCSMGPRLLVFGGSKRAGWRTWPAKDGGTSRRPEGR